MDSDLDFSCFGFQFQSLLMVVDQSRRRDTLKTMEEFSNAVEGVVAASGKDESCHVPSHGPPFSIVISI